MPNNSQAVYELNEYFNKATEVGTLLGYVSGGVSRIIPVQQQPEFNQETDAKPYITYTWRTVPMDDTWWVHTDEISYVIWGPDIDSTSTVANAMMNACRALDESATDLMTYLRARGNVEYVFKYIRVLGSYSPDSTAQEAGRLGWVVTIRMTYTPVAGNHLE